MDRGFFHPDRGYWQTIGEPTHEQRESYPKGTNEVPLKPSPNSEWDRDAKEWIDVPVAISPSDVNAERDRRINAGFTYNGYFFQSDPASRERIDRARLSALAAIMGGAQSGDLQWHGQPLDFVWIAADDARVPMDAHTVVALGNVSAARDGVHIIAANDLKQMDPIPADFADDKYWP